MNIVEIIANADYFAGLSASAVQRLAAVCVAREVPKRDYVFFEGRRGTAVFVLESGCVQLLKSSPEGKEIVIKTVEPGEVFAEVILFERDTYPVHAMAAKTSRVLEIPRESFLALLNEEEFRNEFMAILMQRLRYLVERIENLTLYDVEQRFFRFLTEQYGVGPSYELKITNKDLAASIGTTPETLSRLKERLTREGKVEWDKHRVTLLT